MGKQTYQGEPWTLEVVNYYPRLLTNSPAYKTFLDSTENCILGTLRDCSLFVGSDGVRKKWPGDEIICSKLTSY